jgi:hypothetical protein
MTMLFAAVHESDVGTSETCRDRRKTSAFSPESDICGQL